MKLSFNTIKQALRIGFVEHLMIRACVASDSAMKLRGLLPLLPEDRPYGPEILPVWATRAVEVIGRKAFFTRLPANRFTAKGFNYLLLSLNFSMSHFGSMGVSLLSVMLGVIFGLAFLPARIFTGSEVTIAQTLIPLFLGATFLFWQLFAVVRWILRRKEAKSDNHRSLFEAAIPYLRWNLNIYWIAFWVVVVAMMGLEFFRHQKSDRDYVYQPIASMSYRLWMSENINRWLPEKYRLNPDALVWADRGYRSNGFKYLSSEKPLTERYVIRDSVDFDQDRMTPLREPPNFAENWFWFLFGGILVFGLVPRLVLFPVFGLLLLASKIRLYKAYEMNPYTNLLKMLNGKQTTDVDPEGKTFFDDRGSASPKPLTQKKQSREYLVVTYQTSVDPADMIRFGNPDRVGLYPDQAGDFETNEAVKAWLESYDHDGKLIIVSRLSWTPDRPFFKFLRIVTSGRLCKLDFVDLWSRGNDDTRRISQMRLNVWEAELEKAGMALLLPDDWDHWKDKGALNDTT